MSAAEELHEAPEASDLPEALVDLARATERVLRALRAGGGRRALERAAVAGCVAIGLRAATRAATLCSDELRARGRHELAAAVGCRAEADRAVAAAREAFAAAVEGAGR